MNEWAGFWAIMIVVSLATFAVLSVVVAVGVTSRSCWTELTNRRDRQRTMCR